MSRRILLVWPYRSEYGPRQVLIHVAEALVGQGFEAVLVTGLEGEVTPEVDGLHAEVHRVASLTTFPRTRNPLRLARFLLVHLRAAREIADLAERTGAVAIYSVSEAILCGSIAARRAGVPGIVHAIGMSIGSPPWAARVYIGALNRVTDLFISCSSTVAEMFARWGVPDAKSVVIHNGIATASVAEQARLHPADPGPGPTVGMVAAYDERKGHLLFVEAARLVADRHPNARFFIVGGSLAGHRESLEFEAKVCRRIGELGLADHVVRVGYVPAPEVYGWIAALDVLVVPSRTEAFAHALLEEMACARPIAASGIEGNLDAFIHGSSGLFFDQTPQSLADAVCRLLEDPEWARQLGERARDRVTRYFDLGVTVPANGVVVEQLLAVWATEGEGNR